jgi:lipoate-protein ligase B
MKSITKQQAQEFKERWKFVNDFIAHQIRNTPSEVKLQQFSAMFIVGQCRSPAFLAEEQEVRNRWRLLKQKFNV